MEILVPMLRRVLLAFFLCNFLFFIHLNYISLVLLHAETLLCDAQHGDDDELEIGVIKATPTDASGAIENVFAITDFLHFFKRSSLEAITRHNDNDCVFVVECK